LLYNFVYRGRLYYYQSGYDYELGERLSPGLVAHVFAIRRALDAGVAEYHLMAGDSDYKRKLARSHQDLHWMVWQAHGAKMQIFEALRSVKQQVGHRIAAVQAFYRTLTARVRQQLLHF
jgi:CelD/BcsL family acetyltransferase involved in cellulose biosynthesis